MHHEVAWEVLGPMSTWGAAEERRYASALPMVPLVTDSLPSA